MVCKKSLYCWKNGPCASDQTRKQIWEENIKFRESLRDINQSDHYWSFQISKNRCLCLEGEDLFCERPISQKYRSASLQRLQDIDCTSVTHDCNGLKFRNCFVHCPSHNFNQSWENKRSDTPIPQSVNKKGNTLYYAKHPFNSLNKHDRDKNEYCHRYRNTLLNPSLKPNMKTKFLSQTNLSSLNDSKSIVGKKVFHASCENIQKAPEIEEKMKVTGIKPVKKKTEKKLESELLVSNENKQITEFSGNKIDCEVQTDPVKKKKNKPLKPVLKFPSQENVHDFTPISRTTRKSLCDKNKKIPFVTYGCNNSNFDIGSKKTHNVLASKLEVYPNALLAKQHKKDFLMKYIQSENEFRKKCLPQHLKKGINHSSLWSLDTSKTENKSSQRRPNSKYFLPVVNKSFKKLCVTPTQLEPGYCRPCHKPKIHFY